jgi:hypothetical protein
MKDDYTDSAITKVDPNNYNPNAPYIGHFDYRDSLTPEQNWLVYENYFRMQKLARYLGWGPKQIKKYISFVGDAYVSRALENIFHDKFNQRTKSKKALKSRIFGSNNPYEKPWITWGKKKSKSKAKAHWNNQFDE